VTAIGGGAVTLAEAADVFLSSPLIFGRAVPSRDPDGVPGVSVWGPLYGRLVPRRADKRDTRKCRLINLVRESVR
jgi:hypothetical protein